MIPKQKILKLRSFVTPSSKIFRRKKNPKVKIIVCLILVNASGSNGNKTKISERPINIKNNIVHISDVEKQDSPKDSQRGESKHTIETKNSKFSRAKSKKVAKKEEVKQDITNPTIPGQSL